MQPISGRSIYDEHLDAKGEGFHHVKLYYKDCAKAVEEYAKRGYPVIQCGKIDEDEHYYLDTEKDFRLHDRARQCRPHPRRRAPLSGMTPPLNAFRCWRREKTIGRSRLSPAARIAPTLAGR